MWKLTIKNLKARKLRLAMTALAVVLGVGFVAGTFVLTDTMNSAFDNLFIDVNQGLDVIVRAESEFESQLGGSRQPVPDSLDSRGPAGGRRGCCGRQRERLCAVRH